MKQLPIPSSAFGYDPFHSAPLIRAFYERWHAQGGHSARDCAGIVKRARDLPDLRSKEAKAEWQILDWKLRRCAAEIRLRTMGVELTKQRGEVVRFKKR